ncbi:MULTISPECIES: hypothetical protein [unclassified Duganella]|uniref:hypothetical protein n=1 Tax=unclassified Duganella TaxID=2636909 RepID=UPI000E3575DC|nr:MULTISPECIES: hypothetical protein [unclassified Duganella]RFP14612.1 hypothetical protein D0T23_11435 [Duganella sp. BJB475]RFP30960.1 hypothetical protein D0T21_13815 [Duganella sp. BJB476]
MELRILTWLFPWLMAVLEFLLRASSGNPDAVAFIGPTVGGTALGMLLPLTHASLLVKGHSPQAEGSANTGLIDPTADQWAQRINIILWLGLAAWAASLYLSINHSSPYFPQLDGVRTSLLIGFILWTCAVLADLIRGGK